MCFLLRKVVVATQKGDFCMKTCSLLVGRRLHIANELQGAAELVDRSPIPCSMVHFLSNRLVRLDVSNILGCIDSEH